MNARVLKVSYAIWSAFGIALAPSIGWAQTAGGAADSGLPDAFMWQTVAHNGTYLPGTDRLFNSYSQPSVSADGVVAFRARSKGGDGVGTPLRGIYMRDMAKGAKGVLTTVFDTQTTVPDPNNTLYQDALGTFTEFPAFPRIGLHNHRIVTRGQSNPLWTYMLPDGTETRVGTSGLYVKRGGTGITAASQLGAVPDFPYFSVPGATPGTRFDQFPGSPAVAGANSVVFKGNYTDVVSKTGVYYRDFAHDPQSPVQLVANSDTLIPGQAPGGVRFGSTAPPSASSTDAVFLGLDNEEAPTLGGIYRAKLEPNAQLETLVKFGSAVPGEPAGVKFNKLGEALSYDGRFVAFWGAWGTETRQVTLTCPVDGQAELIAYCNEHYPNGYVVQIPVHQGFFVRDSAKRQTHAVVKTGAEYLDFMYWVFSGRPPGVSDSDSEDFEPPRWRASAFAAVYGVGNTDKAQIAFKGRKTSETLTDGIYMTVAPKTQPLIRTVVETNQDASQVDPSAPAGSVVTAIGLERDGLRNEWLAVTASMLNAATSESWAGVYLTRTK